MKRRIWMAGLLCSAVCLSAESVRAQQQGTNMSDASGATFGLFSRGTVRAFAAAPAPPAVLVTTPAMLDALCVERADAVLVFGTLPHTAQAQAERNVLAVMRGGSEGLQAAATLRASLVASGASPDETEVLLRSAYGLYAAPQPEAARVQEAVVAYNAVVSTASTDFLMKPPDDFEALRTTIGRLSAVANHAYAEDRVYLGLETRGIRYANEADWLLAGQSIQLGDNTYTPYGTGINIADRNFKRIDDRNGVWVLAEEPVPEVPATIYVPVRTTCDVQLMPYTLQEKIIKKQASR